MSTRLPFVLPLAHWPCMAPPRRSCLSLGNVASSPSGNAGQPRQPSLLDRRAPSDAHPPWRSVCALTIPSGEGYRRCYRPRRGSVSPSMTRRKLLVPATVTILPVPLAWLFWTCLPGKCPDCRRLTLIRYSSGHLLSGLTVCIRCSGRYKKRDGNWEPLTRT